MCLPPAPPLVSVVIPNYNHAPYLQQRIESVLAQTWSDFEIILLDDASTDNSAAMLNSYRTHEKVSHVVLNEENSGSPFKQWAKGIALARGEWVWIAESDDWCEPTLLHTLIDGIEPTTSLAFCQSLTVRDNDVLWFGKPTRLAITQAGIEFVQEYMLQNNAIFNASMCIFRKKHYLAIDPEFTNYRFCGDWLFWISLAQHGKVFISGRFLNYFRKHEMDVSGRAYQNGLGYIEYLRLLEHIEKQHIIRTNQFTHLVLLKLQEMLYDSRLSTAGRKEAMSIFHNRLGKALRSRAALRILGKKKFLQLLLTQPFTHFTL